MVTEITQLMVGEFSRNVKVFSQGQPSRWHLFCQEIGTKSKNPTKKEKLILKDLIKLLKRDLKEEIKKLEYERRNLEWIKY
jgi:hypothetical protein